MNDPKLAIDVLREIVDDAYRDGDLAERAALYSAARLLLSDIREHFTPDAGRINGYMSEKIESARWHIAAALGFDIDNGHDDGKHRVWAYGALNTLRDLVAERMAAEDDED